MKKASSGSAAFPKIDLPFDLPFPPMEAKRTEEVPDGDEWQYEPKWDGFRALSFRSESDVVIQSKSGQPLGRYFPEVVAALTELNTSKLALDGEIVIAVDGRLSFDDLLLRLHPAESRIRKLAAEIPAQYFVFDLLFDSRKNLVGEPLHRRRARLEQFFEKVPSSSLVRLSPATYDRVIALDWFDNFGPIGLDGVMAKLRNERYRSGERDGMFKVKRFKDADCVVGGYRLQSGARSIGALLLGLYDDDGVLHHVGNASAFTAKERKPLLELVEPLAGGAGFGGKTPGQSRWSKSSGTGEFIPVDPKLVCEVRYDYFTQGRFRHGVKFLRWRPDKGPRSCTFDQVKPAPSKRKIAFPVG